MQRYFTATLLLEETWSLDVNRLVAELGRRFTGIGEVAAVPGPAPGNAHGQTAPSTRHLTIDHATVALRSSTAPIITSDTRPPLDVVRTWDLAPALQHHNARIDVTCGGHLRCIEGALAYAAATHFVAAALAHLAAPAAVLWRTAYQLMKPGDFDAAADALLTGTIPTTSWVACAPIVPVGVTREGVTGMVTYGLQPIIGRELELAPRPGGPQMAYRCLMGVVRRILRSGLGLRDGLQIASDVKATALHVTEPAAIPVALTVRERLDWLRRDVPAFVLVADDAVVDPLTLRPRDDAVA